MLQLTGLESMMASRYLRRLREGGRTVYVLPGLFLLANLATRGVEYYLAHSHRNVFSTARLALDTALRWGGLVTLLGLVLFGFLAWLIRRYTIFSSISTFGLFLGSAALVVVLSVMSGFEQDLKHKILGANAHILVTSPDRLFTDYQAVAEKLRRVAGVDSVMPYLSNEVMLSSQANLAGVLVKGIEPETAAQVTDLGRNMEQGKLDNLLHPESLRDLGSLLNREEREEREERDPDAPTHADVDAGAGAGPGPDAGAGADARAHEAQGNKKKTTFVATDSHGKPLTPLVGGHAADAAGGVFQRKARKVLPGILIGRELAKNLRIFLGDDVNVISPVGDIGPSGAMPKSRPFRIAGIFYSGMYEYDTKHVYMTIGAAQKFLSLDDEVTGLELRVRDIDATPDTVAAIERLLGDPAYEVKDWQELNKKLFSALKVEKIAMFIVLCFVILVAGFSIVANGIMLVSEKEQEIAILKAMGATDASVLKTFL